MKQCRVCATPLSQPSYAAPAPAMTSLSTLIDIPSDVFVCLQCGHIQSPNLPDVQAFYDNEYRISLQSDEHDQLYETRKGKPVFRTDHQAQIVLELDLPQNAKILDFGAAKATTLKKVFDQRSDLIPYVFDVSEDYRSHWASWVDEDNQATYQLPHAWHGKFDVITAHFVIEHVEEPVQILKELAQCLSPEGRLFFSVPDPLGNSGDLLVADHLNHFTEVSLQKAIALSGLKVERINQSDFRGAHCVIATRSNGVGVEPDNLTIQKTVSEANEKLGWWKNVLSNLKDYPNAAIYGAGFYGTLIASRLSELPICFIDRNPHLQGKKHLNRPVIIPEDCPSNIEAIYAGLNPDHAPEILNKEQEWVKPHTDIIYLT